MKENKLKRLIRKILEAAVPQTNYEDKKFHPTKKPLKIVERFIELSTNQGDIVIDPFCGGGTTAAACYNLGRHCSTSDISKEYIDNAKARIFGHEKKKGLVAFFLSSLFKFFNCLFYKLW